MGLLDWPFARLRTYVAGVTKIPFDDMNAIQDAIGETDRRLVFDNFTGSAVSTAIWSGIVNTPTLPDDSANGANGIVSLDGAASSGAGQSIRTINLAPGSSVRFKARVRVSGVSGSCTMQFGLLGGGAVNLMFYINAASSVTNWLCFIDNVNTTPNVTNVAFGSTYKDIEWTLQGGTVKFYVDGTLIHSAAYGSSLTGLWVTAIAVGTGIARVDSISFGVIP